MAEPGRRGRLQEAAHADGPGAAADTPAVAPVSVSAPVPGPAAVPVAMPEPWLARRLFPLVASLGLLVIGMASTTVGPYLSGKSGWALPDDLWGTLVAAQRLAHLDVGGLYTPPTRLVAPPGAALILVPVAAIIGAAGAPLLVPGGHSAHHAAWLLAGPYEIALSAMVLFAADAIAEHLGVSRPKRAVLAVAGAVALWNVSARWGHPEDAVAVGLFLFGVLALSRARTGRAGWLIGAAAAVQPLVLLALPVVLAAVQRRRLAGLLARAAAPGILVLAAAAAANREATANAVLRQPNWPSVDHATAWISLAPHLSNGAVAAGPARAFAILAACACAVLAGRRWRAARRTGQWSPGIMRELLWWAAVALALRCVFEPVMVAYYVWPTLAVALIAASGSWLPLVATAVAATALTFAAQLPWHSPWTWWAPIIAGLGLTLFLARLPARPGALERHLWHRFVS